METDHWFEIHKLQRKNLEQYTEEMKKGEKKAYIETVNIIFVV